MPYIQPEQREIVNAENVSQPGELNYLITKTVLSYLYNKGISYSAINECVGVLECCKLELYRRIASPYEDDKIQENGDVY